MRILVCGGRDFTDYEFLSGYLSSLTKPFFNTVIIHGNAVGADLLAGRWAMQNKVTQVPFPADWNGLGRKAGPIRNQQMLDEGKPDVVIAFPGGRGTADMVSRARKAGVEVIEVTYP